MRDDGPGRRGQVLNMVRRCRWVLSLMVNTGLVGATSCGSAPGTPEGAATASRGSGAEGAQEAGQGSSGEEPRTVEEATKAGMSLTGDGLPLGEEAGGVEGGEAGRGGGGRGWSTAPGDVDATCRVLATEMCIDYVFEGDGALELATAHCEKKKGRMTFAPGMPAVMRGCYNRDRAGGCAYHLGGEDQVTALELDYTSMTVAEPGRCTIPKRSAPGQKAPAPRAFAACERPNEHFCTESDSDDPALLTRCPQGGGTPRQAPCSREKALGVCSARRGGEQVAIVYYAGNRLLAADKERVVAQCKAGRGATWTE
ncbi:hypothetical protein [Chondromyces apiculatus]|uniref:hypothetical protein n=1 Tax=Chondromyces apiculatus TaxID=51 RepID=UPI0012DF0787|nr:hypothetical protein [Chondromyces apiculatus]